jgi:hypothetical protein
MPPIIARRGDPKGSRNRMQADLAELIVLASAETGFIVPDKDGKPIAGEGGTLGHLRWAALNQPKTYLGLLARVLPYHVGDPTPERTVISREEALMQLQERGLPTDLLNVLRLAPQPLDPGEDPHTTQPIIALVPSRVNGLSATQESWRTPRTWDAPGTLRAAHIR